MTICVAHSNSEWLCLQPLHYGGQVGINPVTSRCLSAARLGKHWEASHQACQFERISC